MKYDGESMTKWGENNPNTFPNPRGGQKNTKKKKTTQRFYMANNYIRTDRSIKMDRIGGS